MSLLTICRNAMARLSLPSPSVIATASIDKNAALMFALAQEEGRALARRAAWRKLTSEQTFTTVALAAQTNALPSDLDWIVPDTIYDRTLRRRVAGPLSPDEWQGIQAGMVTLAIPAVRLRGTSLLMTPTPSAGNTVAFEYITTKWCQSSAAVAQAAWAADDDTAILDEELHTLGLMWRWRKAIGLDFTAQIAAYEEQVMLAITRDGLRPRVSTDPSSRSNYGRNGADVLAGARGNVLVTEGGDALGWD